MPVDDDDHSLSGTGAERSRKVVTDRKKFVPEYCF